MTINKLFRTMYILLAAACLTCAILIILLTAIILTGSRPLPVFFTGLVLLIILWTVFQKTGKEAYFEEKQTDQDQQHN